VPVKRPSHGEQDPYGGQAAPRQTPWPEPTRLRRVLGGAASFRSQVASTLGAQAILLILAVIQGALVARLLGPTGTGRVALALLVMAILRMVLNPGFSASYVYFAGTGQLTVADLTRHGVSVALLAGPVGLGLVGLLDATGALRTILPGIPGGLVLIVAGLLPVNVLFGLLTAILQGQQRIHLMNQLLILDSVLSVAAAAVLLTLGHMGPSAVIIGSAIGDGISVLIAARLLRQSGARFRPAIHRDQVKTLMHYGLRAQGGNFIQFFNYRLDQFVLNALTSPAKVGIYNVSVRLAELVWQLPDAASIVIFARGTRDTAEQMNRFTPRVARWTLGLSIGGAIVLAAAGHFVIGIVYSSKFLGAFVPLLWLLPGTVLFGVAVVLAHDLAGRGMPEYNSVVALLSLIVTVPLDFILIPKWGASGAAIASSIAYAVTFVFSLVAFKRVSRRPPAHTTEPGRP
jgi:O-antigen/teichoic acid export membrane protein